MNYREKLNAATSKWDQAFKRLLFFVEEFDEKQQAFKSNAETWSMVNVLEHLMVAETGIFRLLEKRKPSEATHKITFKEKFNAPVLKAILKAPIRVKAPKVAKPSLTLSKSEVMEQWLPARKGLLEIIATFPESKRGYSVFKHPRAGHLNMIDSIGFLQWHIETHHGQLKRIAKQTGFPSS